MTYYVRISYNIYVYICINIYNTYLIIASTGIINPYPNTASNIISNTISNTVTSTHVGIR